MQFKVRRILSNNIKKEIKNIGFSPSYLDLGALKHKFLNIKIYDLSPVQATIIKQTALASNADAAVHFGVLNHSVGKSNIILSATAAQMQTIAEKLKNQQFSMGKLSIEIIKQIEIFNSCNSCIRPEIMGILNITDNSFSDGGRFLEPKKAIDHALKMIEEGARIIDIGAESTRPGSKGVLPEIEIERILPVIKELRKNSEIKISIDTRNAMTAQRMADFGADIINDVSGFTHDKDMPKIVNETGLETVIMHSRGTPEDMDNLNHYINVMDEVYFELQARVQKALEAGVKPEKIIIDPGFGFAKNNEQNFEVLTRIEEFKSMGFRVLAGLSRKRFIKSILDENKFTSYNDDAANKTLDTLDNLTAGLSFYFGTKGIDIIRVHNVSKTKLMLDLAERIYQYC